MNAGPQRRFTVLGDSGPMLVHNCENLIQALSRDILAVGIYRAERAGLDVRMHVHDEIGIRSFQPSIDGLILRHCMTAPIDWVKGLPIASSVDVLTRYRKA